MAATYTDISRWFDRGVEQGATHMAVFCDTFDHEDYPVYITAESADDARKQVDAARGDMQRLMEVYHLGSDKQAQMGESRAFHYEPLPVEA